MAFLWVKKRGSAVQPATYKCNCDKVYKFMDMQTTCY